MSFRKTDQESSGKNIQSSSAGLESKQAAKGITCTSMMRDRERERIKVGFQVSESIRNY